MDAADGGRDANLDTPSHNKNGNKEFFYKVKEYPDDNMNKADKTYGKTYFTAPFRWVGWGWMVAALLMLVSCGAERSFKKGEKYLALGEYYDAAAQYKKGYSNTKPKDKALRGE